MKKGIKILILGVCLVFFVLLYNIFIKYEITTPWLMKTMRIGCMASGVLFTAAIIKAILGAVKPEAHRAKTIVTLLGSIVSYVSAIVILCWFLVILGVNIGTIVASVGILALIVGIGAESLIADAITGFFMIFENQYNVGDIIEVNGFRGTVVSIGIRTTSIKDNGQNIKIVNNSDMRNITNKSNEISVAVCDFPIPYETEILELEKKIPGMLESIYNANKDIMLKTPVYLGVQELADSSVVLRFKAEVHEEMIFAGKRALNHDLFVEMRNCGIECPFPQVTVHQGDK